MNNSSLVISDYFQNHLLGFEFHKDTVTRIYNFESDSVLGNIYCGYVKDVVKNLNAAFVEFEDAKGFLPLKGMKEKIRQGDKVLVQVSGDRIKTKEYSLTWRIQLSSKCVVLTVGNTDISISRKIEDTETRNCLREYLMPFQNSKYGFILRTCCVNYTKEEIIGQVCELIQNYESMQQKFLYSLPKTAIWKQNFIEKCCRDFSNKYEGNIITDCRRAYEELNQAGIYIKLQEESRISLSNQYSLDKYLREALGKKVWLRSGAYLVIEYTEAMTVIDVNTGKAEIKTDREEMFRRINLEAVSEIVRQIMVRNISGIIIIDFINMKEKENYDDLEQRIKVEAKRDFSQCDVAGFTNLGLMELSRQKYEKPLYEILKEERREK